MEKLIITERNIDVIRKIIEMKYEEVIHNSDRKIKKRINGGIINDFTCRYTYPINKNLYLYINVYPVEHRKTCDNYIKEANTENIIDEYCDNCYRVYGYKLFFILQYSNELLNIILESFGIRTTYKNGEDIITNTWNDCIHKMESVIKVSTYFLCKCGELCTYTNGKRYDICVNCYINSYTRTEDCCICLENGYCWVQLTCKHIIHNYCWNKILKQCKQQCPLCRAATSVEIVNPYN